MTREELEKKIRDAVAEYIADEETYDDNARLQIDLEKWEVTVVDSEDDEPEDADTVDYYDVMDFIRMSPDEPGKWEVDEEAVKSVAEETIG